MNFTYAQLQDAHKARLESERGTVSLQLIRNHNSTLNTYLTFLGKNLDSTVGHEFFDDFQVRAGEFVKQVCPTNNKTAADKLSILRALKQSAETFKKRKKIRQAALEIGVASEFQLELNKAIKTNDKNMTDLAAKVAIHVCTLHRWLNGTPPHETTSIPAIHRLERELKLERGHLERVMPTPTLLPLTVQRNDAFTRRHGANVLDEYLVSYDDLTEEFRQEWFAFLAYKTIECPIGIVRSRKGRWQTLPLNMVKPPIAKDPWLRPTPSEACGTAQRALSSFRGFFGFLRRQPSPDGDLARGGMGLPLAEVQSIALFAVPEFVQGFFMFMKARSGDIVHTGHAVLAGLITTLVHPEYGYLVQKPEFFSRIEGYAKGRSWVTLCAETMVLCGKWQDASVGNKSRDPESPIHQLLRNKAPLVPLFRAIAELDAQAAKEPGGGVQQAKCKRNALLLALAIANPLRERTLTITKYVAPDTDSDHKTNLYQNDSGEWRLFFSKDHFKNRSTKNEDYDAPLPAMLSARINEYLTKYRPLLIRKNPLSPWLFPSSRDGDMLTDLSGVLNWIAKRYIPEVKRLRAHAIRHLVATDFLARNPGQYTVVAELLHDTLETVLATYAHCKKESSFKAHERHLNTYFNK